VLRDVSDLGRGEAVGEPAVLAEMRAPRLEVTREDLLGAEAHEPDPRQAPAVEGADEVPEE
jgi:hypothetical protein